MVAAKPFLFSQVTSTEQISRLLSIWYDMLSNKDFSFLIIGVTSLSMLQNPNNSIQPDFYTNKISDFLSLRAATV